VSSTAAGQTNARSYQKKLRNGFLALIKKQDRIDRILGIMRPSAERPLAAGEKIPDNPVNPV
jgi:hypothetical protein